MKRTMRISYLLMAAVAAVGIGMLYIDTARAHCDTMGGPIIPEAQAALDSGDVTPVLKWVMADDEAEIRSAFSRAVAVRSLGPDAQELADRYFLETLIRIHRAGEGAPYTGIKDEPVARIVALADSALAGGSADAMIERLSGHMAAAIREKYNAAMEARKGRDVSVEAGRVYVEAYVVFMHYVEGIHGAIMSTGGHGHTATAAGHAHEQH